MNHRGRRKTKVNLRDVNIFSYITFGYTLKLFRKGLKIELEEKDLYEAPEGSASKKCGNETEKQWDKSKSMCRLFWNRFGWEYTAISIATILWSQINSITLPYSQSKLISFFEENQSSITKREAYMCGAIVITLKMASVFFWRHIALRKFYLATKIRASLKSLLYRKTLKLSPAAFGDTDLGNIVTILTKDINTIDENLGTIMELTTCSLQMCTISYLLWTKMKEAAFVGMGVLFLVLLLQVYISILLTKIRLRVGKYIDARLLVTQETLSAIKTVKMYGWELFFNKKISEARKKEIYIMIIGQYLTFSAVIIALLTSKLTFLLVTFSYIWMGYTTSTEQIFYVLSLFYDLKFVFGFTITFSASRAAKLRAALIRLQRLLNTEEIKMIKEKEDKKPYIKLDGVEVKIKDKKILNNIYLKIDTPGLNLVTGPVGSGKSSLLKTILREYCCQGNVEVHGTVSYASQEPWLFPSSIRDNILFGQKYDNVRYQKVVRVCALEYDFSLLEHGDETLVTDRGSNLSKGQQARVNLARAVYRDSDIYLLDDPLTALDIRVQNFIYNVCICGFLKEKICLLVTQNESHLSKCDKVIRLEKSQIIFSQNSVTNIEYNVETNINDTHNLENIKSLIEEEVVENKVYSEMKKIGKVELTVYKKYFVFGGGLLIFCAIMSLFVIAQSLESYSDQLLTNWVDLQQDVLDLSADSTVNASLLEEKVLEKETTFNWYTILVVVEAALSLVKFYAFLKFCRRASINIHGVLLSRVVNGVMTFFDTHFIGNVLNRFSSDLYNIDDVLPFTFPDAVTLLFNCIGSLILLINVNWIFSVPSGIFIIGLILLRRGYIPTGRSIKRLEAAMRSPLIGQINSSVEGLATIRAFKAEQILKDQFDVNQDLYTSAYFTLVCTSTGFEFFLDFFCALFSILVILRFLLFDHNMSAGKVGLAITQVFILTDAILWVIRQWAEIENQMTCVERILEYITIKKEEFTGTEMQNWPVEGRLVFQNVSLNYEGTTRLVLKNISFSINPRQKVGIVGRTGAGKSSIISTLFRLYDYKGKILIDGVNIKDLSLSFLRKKLAIIPQDPILFTGTIRTNIDPNEIYTDQEIWKAIQKVKIEHLICNLDLPIAEGGCNFSVGQKQLICLARAVVGKYKIVVLDEATANMDSATDEMLHAVIREIFADCTILMIAHKLRFILDCDLVIVMEKGELIEYNSPSKLLCNSSSIFYNMWKESSINQ